MTRNILHFALALSLSGGLWKIVAADLAVVFDPHPETLGNVSRHDRIFAEKKSRFHLAR
jgi:hypothetical protein